METLTYQQIRDVVESYLDIRHSHGSAFAYGFECGECSGSANARDRKKLVRNNADRTLCWDCMDAGANLYL